MTPALLFVRRSSAASDLAGGAGAANLAAGVADLALEQHQPVDAGFGHPRCRMVLE